MKNAGKRNGTKRLWLKDHEIKGIAESLAMLQNPESHIIFGLLLSTGQKFSRLAKVRWNDFNARLGIIRIGDRSVKLPESVVKGIEALREKAISESHPIISLQYSKYWHYQSRASVRAGFSECGVMEVRNTFCLKHWQAYQDKARLKADLGLSNIRHIPKEIFQAGPAPLFQGVL